MTQSDKNTFKIGGVLLAIVVVGGVYGNIASQKDAAQQDAAQKAADRKEESQRQAKAKFLAAHPEVVAAERKKQKQQAEQKRQQREAAQEAPRKVAKAIMKELTESFGHPGFETTWFAAIKNLSVDGDTVTVQTNLVKNEIFNDTIQGVCSGVSNSVYRKPGLETIVVRGSDDSVLVRRNGLSDSCSP